MINTRPIHGDLWLLLGDGERVAASVVVYVLFV